MDVICEQCKAEYEFDDALVGERGTTVKCSRCGHVFRVHARSAAEGQRATLQLRFARDGRVVALSSLRELQQRIAGGEVGRDDELGREGFPFRRLADVPELKNFFPNASMPASTFPTAPPPSARAPSISAGPRVPANAPTFAEPPTGVMAPRAAPKPGQRTVLGIGPDAQAGAPTPHFGVPVPRGAVPADGEAPTLPSSSGGALGARAMPSSLPPPSTRLGGQGSPWPTGPASPRPPGNGTSRAPTGAPPPAEPLPPAYVPNALPPRGAEQPSYAPMTAAPTRPAEEPPRAPISGVPTRPAAEPPVRGLALDTAEAFDDRPDAPITSAAPRREPREPFPSGRAGLATEQRLERPGALAEVMQRPSGGPGAAPAAPAVRLRVGDEDAPLERTTGGSKLPYVAGAAVLLAAAGWGAVAYLGAAPERSASVVTTTPTPTPLAVAPDAGAEAILSTDAGPPSSSAATEPAAPPKTAEAASAVVKGSDAAGAKPATKAAEKADKAGDSASDKPDKPVREPASVAAPKDYGALVARGDQLFAKGDLEGAREAFASALAQRASGSEGNSGLGFVLLAMGQPREALPYLSRAAASGFAEASVGLGDAQRKLGNKDDAVEAYGTYLARLPNGPRAKYARAQLDALSGGSDKPSGGSPPATARDTEEPQNAPSSDYRPAGEVEGAPTTDEPSP